MKIALDIDDTITKYPDFFSQISHANEAVVVTSRQNTQESIEHTIKELELLNINYSNIYFADWSGDSEEQPIELVGKEILLYQKIIAFKQEQVEAVFDDDPTVHLLVKKYLPDVALFSPI
ncbi:hypothetical protein [Colwellia piezophila]|uniref:hypothetical protein n=1 Tax=Colwellia piezophila TaxID=211668 RepID=UPI0003722143|nr:hypothetical protein [Colwellia piezophila]